MKCFCTTKIKVDHIYENKNYTKYKYKKWNTIKDFIIWAFKKFHKFNPLIDRSFNNYEYYELHNNMNYIKKKFIHYLKIQHVYVLLTLIHKKFIYFILNITHKFFIIYTFTIYYNIIFFTPLYRILCLFT